MTIPIRNYDIGTIRIVPVFASDGNETALPFGHGPNFGRSVVGSSMKAISSNRDYWRQDEALRAFTAFSQEPKQIKVLELLGDMASVVGRNSSAIALPRDLSQSLVQDWGQASWLEQYESAEHDAIIWLRLVPTSQATASTSVPTDTRVGRELDALLSTDADDDEIGTDSEFVRRLNTYVETHGEQGLCLLDMHLRSSFQRRSVLVPRIISALANLKSPATKEYRFGLFAQLLEDPSPAIRDAALLAVFDMGDPRSLTVLERARGREENAHIRRNLDQVLKYLRSNA